MLVLDCLEPPCAVGSLFSGATFSQDVGSSFVEHAARVRVEQRGVFDEEAARQRALHDLQRRSGWAHVHTQRGYGGDTVPSQGKASEAASRGSPRLVEASRPWNPLATA